MTDITLALPFALPPPELAPDLLRALQAPALAALLARHSTLQHHVFDNNSRVLPHEAWLAHTLGLASAPTEADTGAPLATACMRGCGLGTQAAQSHWFMLQPAHVQISRTHMLLTDLRALQLSEADSRGLYDLARPYFEEAGKTLLHGAPGLWFLRADDWAGLNTASPDATTTQSMTDWLPEGDHARDFRRLQNEVQMLWHEHPINEARQARGLQAINSCWLWGGAAPSSAQGGVAIGDGMPWMDVLASSTQPSARQLIAQPGTVMLAGLISSAQAGDWADWLARMQQLEQEWFTPLLAALKDGSVGGVKLVLSHRHGWTEVTSGKLAQRKFWRKPSLTPLLKQS
ncbi:hypothetical protein GTP38_20335 [Duganella sp. FT94W]|uniref:Phosphoglycerate mutase n=1 Tax=Duganella lactea TaxID=2692173 RepID=A0ABW9VDM2_9BURK|nr:hypothetical protein [Duganella lactea]MYM36683.1 hypothetical protein [Duganella lactea]